MVAVVVAVVVVIVDIVLLVVVVAVVSDEGVDATVILWALDVRMSLEVTDSDINIDSGEDDKVSVKPSTELPFCSVSLTFCLLGIILFR